MASVNFTFLGAISSMVRFRVTNLMTLTSVGRSAHVSVPWPIAHSRERRRRRRKRTWRAHITCITRERQVWQKKSPLCWMKRARNAAVSRVARRPRDYLPTSRALVGTETRRDSLTLSRSLSIKTITCCHVSTPEARSLRCGARRPVAGRASSWKPLPWLDTSSGCTLRVICVWNKKYAPTKYLLKIVSPG